MRDTKNFCELFEKYKVCSKFRKVGKNKNKNSETNSKQFVGFLNIFKGQCCRIMWADKTSRRASVSSIQKTKF